MEKDFCLGVLVGVLGGAIAAANSFKVRKTVKDGQEQIMSALSKMSKTGNEKSSEQNEGQDNQNQD